MIRQLAAGEMGGFAPIGKRFFEEAGGTFTDRFDVDYFTFFWDTLIDAGHALVVGAWVDGKPAGAIGGIVAPDPCNGDPVMNEAFWFVDPDRRGCGVRLFKEYLALAETVTKRQTMVHLLSSMPEKLEKLYKRAGFRPVETHYVRSG